MQRIRPSARPGSCVIAFPRNAFARMKRDGSGERSPNGRCLAQRSALARVLGNPVRFAAIPLAARLVGESKADVAALQERAGSRSRDRARIAGVDVLARRRARQRAYAPRGGNRASGVGAPPAARAIELRPISASSRRQFYRDRALALEQRWRSNSTTCCARKTCRLASTTTPRTSVSEIARGAGKCSEISDDVEALLGGIATAATCDDRFRAIARWLETACESGERARIRRALARARGVATRWNGRLRSRALASTSPSCRQEELLEGSDRSVERSPLLDALRSCLESNDERWEALSMGLTQHATAAPRREISQRRSPRFTKPRRCIRRCERPAKTFAAYLPNFSASRS